MELDELRTPHVLSATDQGARHFLLRKRVRQTGCVARCRGVVTQWKRVWLRATTDRASCRCDSAEPPWIASARRFRGPRALSSLALATRKSCILDKDCRAFNDQFGPEFSLELLASQRRWVGPP
jgi:hypothetical protein